MRSVKRKRETWRQLDQRIDREVDEITRLREELATAERRRAELCDRRNADYREVRLCDDCGQSKTGVFFLYRDDPNSMGYNDSSEWVAWRFLETRLCEACGEARRRGFKERQLQDMREAMGED